MKGAALPRNEGLAEELVGLEAVAILGAALCIEKPQEPPVADPLQPFVYVVDRPHHRLQTMQGQLLSIVTANPDLRRHVEVQINPAMHGHLFAPSCTTRGSSRVAEMAESLEKFRKTGGLGLGPTTLCRLCRAWSR